MQERSKAGSSRDLRRSVHGPAQSQGNPLDGITPQAHGHTSTSTSSSNTYDAGQYAASTPQTFSTSSSSHTPVGSILSASDYFPPPLQQLQAPQSHQPMSVDNPQQPSNPPSLDYGAFNYAPGGALVWEFDNNLDVPEFQRFYEPQGELVQELQEPQPAAGDFALPEPVSRRESATALQTAQLAATQQPLGSASHSPVSMPIVVGTITPQQQQPGPFAPPPRQASTQSVQSQTSLKRKSETDSSGLPLAGDDNTPSSKRPTRARTGSTTTAPAPNTAERKPMATRSQSAINAGAQPALTIQTSDDNGIPDNTSEAPGSARPGAADAGNVSPTNDRAGGQSKSRKVIESPSKFSNILPAGKVFPIQIGSELFRLSGASISSDAPSYFSHFFSEQLLSNSGKSGTIRTLYIDRDPQTFRDISLHLQGYHVKPRDGEHYVRLFADAQFYSLPRLTQQLFKTDIYIQIGDRNFQIPRDIFSAPGNSPNFFSLGFAHFFSTPSEVFPGLDRTSLLRPPSIQPPSVPNRSADVFQDILHLLQGYPVNIRDESHRQDLLRDARYFHLKGLEQKLIPCDISYNLARQKSEIVMRLEDIRQSGVSFEQDPEDDSAGQNADLSAAAGGGGTDTNSLSANKAATPSRALTPAAAASGFTSVPTGQISYARPFTDETSHALIVETSAQESTRISLATMRAHFADQTKARIASLFQVIANKMNLPATQPLGLMMVERGGGLAAMPVSPSNSGVSGDTVRVAIDRESWCEINGGVVEWENDDYDHDMDEEHIDVDDNGMLNSAISEDDIAMHEDDDNAAERAGKHHSAANRSRPRLPQIRRWRPSGASEDKTLDPRGEWVVTKAHWRIKVQPSEDDARIVEVVMQVVKLQGWVGERTRNGWRGFLV